MAFYFYILLLLSGLTGTHSVTTVSKVSVNIGQSLKIPCLYGPKYLRHVKYLCQGYYWNSCSYAIKTNESPRSKMLSISDNKVQRIFTVTMNQLSGKNSDFWCAVEINQGSDDKQYFHLSFTTGIPILKVNNQEITGFVGDNTSINFHLGSSGKIKWCRLNGVCVTDPSGFIERTRVIMKKEKTVLTVTMIGLKLESGGWYLCAAGEYQMPVHVTVREKPSTTAAPSGTAAVTSLENTQDSNLFDPKSLIIPLSVLAAIVTVTLIVWFLLKRKQTKAEAPVTTKMEDGTSDSDVKRKRKLSPQAEAEVTYSSVVHMKQNPSQKSRDEREPDVLYSSVVTRKEQNAKTRSPARNDEDVVYSSVITVKQQPA